MEHCLCLVTCRIDCHQHIHDCKDIKNHDLFSDHTVEIERQKIEIQLSASEKHQFKNDQEN